MSMDSNIQALGAFGVSQQVTANNVANVSTEGFRASRVDLEDTAQGGVAVADIRQSSESGPLIPNGRPRSSIDQTEAVPDYVEGSNTDIGKEMVDMGVNQAAFGANVSAVRAWDQMTGAVLDMVV